MKVAIDSGPLTSGDSVRGIGVNTREVFKAFKLISNKEIQITEADFSKGGLSKFEIVHYQFFRPFFVDLPFIKPANKVVLTIHDLIPVIYPTHYPAGIKGCANFRINKFLIKKYVDAIITISETSKKDICRFLGVAPVKVHVIYLAPRPIFKKLDNGSWESEIKKQYGLPDRFALYVGDINFNKNIPNLIKACSMAKIPLVIVGKQAEKIESLDLNHPELLHLKNLDWSDIKRLGFVPDEDLVKLYNLASVYIQPSFYEGFGLPSVEAVACKTPLVVARSQCMVEVLGDEFSYCDPKDALTIAEAIKKPNINKRLPRVYTWQRTADETIEIYNKIAK